MKEIDINSMTTEALKALAYDQIVTLEILQANLKAINREIKDRANAPKPELTSRELKAV